MYITSSQLLSDFNVLANALYLGVLLQALRKTPWRSLRFDRLNLFLAACACLVVLWTMRAGVSQGLALHYLGVTTLTLVFGWPLALVGSSLVLAVLGLAKGLDWAAFGIDAVATGVVPVLVTHGLYRLVDRRLPKNFFIYLYLCAFLGGMLALLASALLVAALLALSGAYPVAKIGYEYLAYLPLLVLPEGILNGMVMTMLMVFKPHWVTTFDADQYLGRGR